MESRERQIGLQVVLDGRVVPEMFLPVRLASSKLISAEEVLSSRVDIDCPDLVECSLDWAEISCSRSQLIVNTARVERFEAVVDLVAEQCRPLTHGDPGVLHVGAMQVARSAVVGCEPQRHGAATEWTSRFVGLGPGEGEYAVTRLAAVCWELPAAGTNADSAFLEIVSSEGGDARVVVGLRWDRGPTQRALDFAREFVQSWHDNLVFLEERTKSVARYLAGADHAAEGNR